MTKKRPYIFLTKITVFALVLSVIPMPQLLLDLSPFWILLVYIYWLNYFPSKGNFFIALILGLLVDIIQGGLLGQNALALIISSIFVISAKQSFFVSNFSTQQIYVFIAAGIYLGFILLTHSFIQGLDFNYFIFFTPLSTAIFWPVVKTLLAKLKH